MPFRTMTPEFFNDVARSRMGWSRVVNILVKDKDEETKRQEVVILSMLEDWSQLRVLDMGCGVGRLTPWFNEIADAEGVDWSSEMLAVARTNNPGMEFHHGALTDPILPNQFPDKFDLTFQWCVFLHITNKEEWQQAIKNMRDLSRKYILYCDKVNSNAVVDYVRVYTPDEIIDEVESTGEFALMKRVEHWCPPEDMFELFLFERFKECTGCGCCK